MYVHTLLFTGFYGRMYVHTKCCMDITIFVCPYTIKINEVNELWQSLLKIGRSI